MNYDCYYEARSIIESFLRKDLMGPVRDDEVIKDAWPFEYYLAGRLFPQEMKIKEDEQEKCIIDIDEPVNLCYERYPSSMALSFSIMPGVRELAVEVSFAWYEPLEKEHEGRKRKKQYEWHRHACTKTIYVDTEEKSRTDKMAEGLELRTYLQRRYADGSKTLTIALVNIREKQVNWVAQNASIFFQPRIVVMEREKRAIFIEKKLRIALNQDSELLNLEMLYRHKKCFAIGHGCSAAWDASGDCATRVYTEIIPTYDLLQLEPAIHVDPGLFSFQFLAESSADEIYRRLQKLTESYERWIVKKETNVLTLPSRYHKVAKNNLLCCRKSLRRIQDGIKLLWADKQVFQAFQLVNRAMLLQNARKDSAVDPSQYGWYPFQLAFILQEINSIACPDDQYRDVVDLLWFPTGGGKTEAYLGLAAFTIFLRRIRASSEQRSGAGVTIIMRYTLRLLTLQQFNRASALICACELLRRQDPGLLGTEEICIGLWVGGRMTPIQRVEAEKVLNVVKEKGFDSLGEDEPNPCQIHACPLCGTNIKAQQYIISGERMVIACPNEKCEFHSGLPLYLIDDDIYDFQPTLIVATIDKFARMTWEEKVGKLFALRSELLPPELIIQDELHLISGPLGTVAGLYEVAIDKFCKHNGIGAKIISSTATIRNAEHQILNLYGRNFFQFPPQGAEISDSYFAVEASPEDKPSRRYIGLLAPGTSGDTLLVRVYAILIFATRYLKERGFPPEVVDTFWTLTGYFNSLKQLGGSVVRVIDDVSGRLKYLCETKFKSYFPKGATPPEILEYDELTSRKKSSEIGETLKRLEHDYTASDVIDVILASSMISVGIDIGRLGLMVLQGQPKSSSEYIQATSRVGRKTPGLVVTMYDASRSRDRSHYEQFLAYHSALYKYVEATSLTPFADRARDRALHAVLIILCRHLIDDLRGNEQAGNICSYHSEAEDMIMEILSRVNGIDLDESQACKKQLYNILTEWESKAMREGKELVYQKYFDKPGIPLLTSRFDAPGDAFPTLNSMRNVDVECDVLLEEM